MVSSPIVDNAMGLSEEDKIEVSSMVANVTMWGVQGAVWNAIILWIGGITLVAFVLPK